MSSALLLFSTGMQAQRIFELMETDGVTLKEVQKEAAIYFAKVGTGEGTGYKLFKRWEYHALTNLKADGTILSSEDHAAAIRTSKKSAAQTNERTNALTHGDAWKTSAGSCNEDRAETGRITALYIEPINQQIIYTSISGDGMWNSNNGGNSWKLLGSQFKNSTISAIEMDPNHSNILYIGTAKGQLLKSIDGGLNFKVLFCGSSAVRGLFMDPNDKNIYAVMEENGLYHTPDGGATWNQIVVGDHMDHVRFNLGTITRAYADDKHFYKSTKCIQYIDDTMYITSGRRIYKNSASGASFVDISVGLGTH